MANYDFMKRFNGFKNNPKRNAFDLSRKECYTLPFGVIAPVSFDFVQPDEHYKVTASSYVQTNNMRDDNFTTLYNHMKAVFVPMSSLKRNYNQFTPSVDSSRLRKDLSVSQNYYQPTVDMNILHQHLFPWYFLNFLLQQAVSITPACISYYCVYTNLGSSGCQIYNEKGIDVTSSIQATNPSLFILSKFFYTTVSDISTKYFFVQHAYTVLSQLISDSQQFFVYDYLRILDSLGFGNFWPVYNDCCNVYLSTYIDSIPANSLQPAPTPAIHSLFVFDFDSNNNPKVSWTASVWNTFFQNWAIPLTDQIHVSLDKLVAFQYYIAMCERSNYRKPDTFVFTLDYFANLVEDSAIHDNLVTNQLNGSVYEAYTSDYGNFQDSVNLIDMLQTDFNDVSSFTWTMQLIELYLFQLHNPLLRADLFTSAPLSMISGTNPQTSDLNIANLNTVDSLYKTRQSLLRAGVKAADYMKAFFGIKGDDNITEPILMLDDSRSVIKINGLFAMAQTAEAELGARGARGNGSAGIKFSFDSNGYGYLFYIQYITCDTFYENTMIQRDSQFYPSIYPTPYTQNLGLDVVYSRDSGVMYKDGAVWKSRLNAGVVGYSSHDWPLKTKLDLVHGFFTNIPLTYASTNYSNIESIQSLPDLSRGNAPAGGFVPTLYEQQANCFSYKRDMYFHPSMLNGVFTQMNDGVIYASAIFDPFKIATMFQVYKVAPMSVLGLPKNL